MTNAEKKAIKESLKKGIAIWKKNIQFWQQKKKEAEAMIAHDKKRLREDQAKLKSIK